MTLGFMLCVPVQNTWRVLGNIVRNQRKMEAPDITGAPLMAPVEEDQEVWAAGVTYLRSKVEREAESSVADVYARVYEAERPELFFKSVGSRVVGDGGKIRIRRDSAWNVPEPELTVIVNNSGEVFGYTVGNDVSSRSIEGENPLRVRSEHRHRHRRRGV
jgi:2-dehydro-3-deoxy-D-arabinonate dehydratase